MYGQEMQRLDDCYEIAAVCDINPKQLEKTQGLLGLSEDKLFSDEESFFAKKSGCNGYCDF